MNWFGRFYLVDLDSFCLFEVVFILEVVLEEVIDVDESKEVKISGAA